MSVITKPEPQIEEVVVIDEFDELCIKVENYIREHGWTRYRTRAATGEVCLYGAVISVCLPPVPSPFRPFQHAGFTRFYKELCKRLAIHTGKHNDSSVVDWNDMPGRKVEEIYEFLEHARSSEIKEALK